MGNVSVTLALLDRVALDSHIMRRFVIDVMRRWGMLSHAQFVSASPRRDAFESQPNSSA